MSLDYTLSESVGRNNTLNTSGYYVASHFPVHSELAIEVHKANSQCYVDTIHCGAGVTSSQAHI